MNTLLSSVIYSGFLSLRHDTIALTRVDLPLLCAHIQVDRPDELEERIVVCFRFAFFQPLVAPDQQADENLDLLEGKVEADAHSLAGGETVREAVLVVGLHGVCIFELSGLLAGNSTGTYGM